jgi:hypothetical protein
MKLPIRLRNFLIAAGAAITFYICFVVGITNPALGYALFLGAAAIGAWLNWRYWRIFF